MSSNTGKLSMRATTAWGGSLIAKSGFRLGKTSCRKSSGDIFVAMWRMLGSKNGTRLCFLVSSNNEGNTLRRFTLSLNWFRTVPNPFRNPACASDDLAANESRSRNRRVETSNPSKYLDARNCFAVNRLFGYRVTKLASTSRTSAASLRHCDAIRLCDRPSSMLVRRFESEFRFENGGPECVWIACRMHPSEYRSSDGAGGISSQMYSGAVRIWKGYNTRSAKKKKKKKPVGTSWNGGRAR